MFLKKESIELLESNIFLNLSSMTKEEAIKFCGSKLIEAGYVKDGYIESMLNRESILSTYMNYGIAIPHGDRLSQELIIKSGIVVAQFKSGVNFSGDSVAEILVATAGKGNDHLRILSGLAKITTDPSLVDKMSTTNTKSDILAILENAINK